MLKKLFTHTALYGIAPQVPKIAGLAVLPLITRYLTPLDYGIFGITTATIGLVSVFSSLGLRLILVNAYFKSPNRYTWIWRQIYGFLILWSLPFSIFTSIILWFILPQEVGSHSWEIVALNVLPVVLLGNAAMFGTTYFQIAKKPLPIVFRVVVFGLLTVCFNYYSIAVLKMGYMGWFWSTFIVTLLNNVSYWYTLTYQLKIIPIFGRWRSIWRFLKVSLPTIPHYYSMYLLNTSDKLVLDFLKVSPVDIGRYNVAYSFGNYFNTFGMASGTAISPLLSDCYKNSQEKKARNLVFIQHISLLLACFVASVWMKELFSFFFRNKSLQANYDLAVVVVMAYSYRAMYIGANSRLMFLEQTRSLWKVTFMAGVLNVLLNVALVPFFGYSIAAYTTFFSLMYMGYAGFFINDFKKNNVISYYPIAWLMLTISLTAVALVSVSSSYVLKGLLSGVSILLFVWFLKRYNDSKG